MTLQAYAMSCAVYVVFSKARLVQHISRQGIGSLSRDTTMQTRLTGLHGLQNDIVDFKHARLRGFTQANGARHIGAVAMITRPHINCNQFAALDPPLTGMSMRHRTMRARRDDSFKRQPVGSKLYHVAMDFPGHFLLGHTRLNPLAKVSSVIAIAFFSSSTSYGCLIWRSVST